MVPEEVIRSYMNRKVLFSSIIIGVLLLGVVAYSIFTAVSRGGKEPVSVNILPGDASLTANGQKISTGTQYLAPGTYTIEAKRDGFSDFKYEVMIGKPNKEKIDIALIPVSDEAKKWAKDNQKLYLEREGKGGEEARKKGEEFFKLNPIARQLPIRNILYTISYTVDPSDPTDNSIILHIEAPEGYREGVINKIRQLGYDPTDYKINFKVYENPFDHE